MDFWQRFLRYTSGASWRNKGIQSGSGHHSVNSAVPVTVDGALQLSSVWACVKLITETVASLPIEIYKKDLATGIKSLLPDHPLAILFGGRVNRWQTRVEFLETMVYQLILHGNSFCAIQRGVGNRIIGLIPLMSAQMLVTLLADGTVTYTYTDNGSVTVYAAESIWHNKLFGNGIIGLSALSYGRNAIGIGLAAEQVVTKIYQNGGKPSGVLTIDKLLTPEQRAQIKENFREMTEGDNNRLFTLEAGFTYQQISLSPQDIELLSSRKFQIEDICRFFGVPSVLVNDTGASTTWGSGIQQIVEGFFKFGIRPCLNRMQESMKCWLLPPEERLLIEICFDACDLLMPGIAERIKMYKDGVQGGIMTSNQSRGEEGWNPLPGGDDLLVQRQMVALKDLGNVTNTAPSYVTPAN